MKESYRKADETELVKVSLDGDKLAFGEIVNRYRKMVARTVKGMLGDSVFAEDIGQEVFVKLYHSLSEFRGESKLATYIQRIAVNLTLNEIKRRKRFFSMFTQKGRMKYTKWMLQMMMRRKNVKQKKLSAKRL